MTPDDIGRTLKRAQGRLPPQGLRHGDSAADSAHASSLSFRSAQMPRKCSGWRVSAMASWPTPRPSTRTTCNAIRRARPPHACASACGADVRGQPGQAAVARRAATADESPWKVYGGISQIYRQDTRASSQSGLATSDRRPRTPCSTT